ncbi:MAG: XkdF-like putative serine protease domain-containing protein [Thermodesulfobacteriota bacterium]
MYLTIQKQTISEIFDNTTGHQRIFESLVSLEKIDSQGDLVLIDGLNKAMAIWFELGAPITDSHSNKIVGKGLEFGVRTVDGVKATWLKSMIFDKYKIHDNVWDKIKSGEYKGVSIGGETFSRFRKCDIGGRNCHNVIPSLELFEVAVVRRPANNDSLIIAKQNFICKSCEETTGETMTDETEQVITEKTESDRAKLDIYIHQTPPATSEVVQEPNTNLEKADFCTCGEDHSDGISKEHIQPYVEVPMTAKMFDAFNKLNDSFQLLNEKVIKLESSMPTITAETISEAIKQEFAVFTALKDSTTKAEHEDDDEEEDEEKRRDKKKRRGGDATKPDDPYTGAKGTKKKQDLKPDEKPEDEKPVVTKEIAITPKPSVLPMDKPQESPEIQKVEPDYPFTMDEIIKHTTTGNIYSYVNTKIRKIKAEAK